MAWTRKGGEAWFGDEGSGVALGLMEGLRQVKISHTVDEGGVYAATRWRGDWSVELDIICLEVWGDFTVFTQSTVEELP